ncbi:MAG: type II toxin-antitoxin system VapC family toxin [Balneolales bacterium]|nr:type II toxin-antitoxin system VapC family toxin [Balneolales bacterium]
MALSVVIDTDILIDFGLDKKDAVETMSILEEKYQLTISVITAMELYSGCRSKRDLKKVEALIEDLRIQFVSKPISERAFELMKKFRSSHGAEINDTLIAATAIESNAKMISQNQKHYKFLPDLDLLEYPLSDV